MSTYHRRINRGHGQIDFLRERLLSTIVVPLGPRGYEKKLTTEGTESTEKTVRGCSFSVISVTSVVMLFGCGSAALRYQLLCRGQEKKTYRAGHAPFTIQVCRT